MSSKSYCPPKHAKHVARWITDLDSHYSCEHAPSEPQSFRGALSHIGSSHRGISERFAPEGLYNRETRSSQASSRKVPRKPYVPKESSQHSSSGARHSKNSMSPSTAASHSRSFKNTPARGSGSTKAAPRLAPPRKSSSRASQPRTLPRSSHSGRDKHTNYPYGLDPCSTALDEKLSRAHREFEDRAEAFATRRLKESNKQYAIRINNRLGQLNNKLEDLDMRWEILEMEQEAGLRP